MPGSVIVSTARTPIGKLSGAFASLSAMDLGGIAIKAALERGGVGPDQVDYVIMGHVLQAGQGQITARQAAVKAGIPMSVPATTINKVCLSGINALYLADQMIQSGDAEVVVAGGMESMTNAPYLLPQARSGYRMGHGALVDSMIHDGLWDPYNNFHMGSAAEMIAARYGITREEQDIFAAESHRRAAAATSAGLFKDEILPVEVPPARKGDAPGLFDGDESIRPGTTTATLARLKPAFEPDGTVTAGNAPGVSDGAAALVIASAERARELGFAPLGVIRAQATSGREPEWMGLAPIDAVRAVAQKAGWPLDSVDLFELNEAFSVQALAVNRELGLDPAKVNVHGGAVALGHPIGASGARVLVTLLYALQHLGKKRGIAALCLGGGNAIALAVERI